MPKFQVVVVRSMTVVIEAESQQELQALMKVEGNPIHQAFEQDLLGKVRVDTVVTALSLHPRFQIDVDGHVVNGQIVLTKS